MEGKHGVRGLGWLEGETLSEGLGQLEEARSEGGNSFRERGNTLIGSSSSWDSRVFLCSIS